MELKFLTDGELEELLCELEASGFYKRQMICLAELQQRRKAESEAEPVAWRYRFVHTPKSEGRGSYFTTDWVLTHREDECNPSDCFERQPLYVAPYLASLGGHLQHLQSGSELSDLKDDELGSLMSMLSFYAQNEAKAAKFLPHLLRLASSAVDELREFRQLKKAILGEGGAE